MAEHAGRSYRGRHRATMGGALRTLRRTPTQDRAAGASVGYRLGHAVLCAYGRSVERPVGRVREEDLSLGGRRRGHGGAAMSASVRDRTDIGDLLDGAIEQAACF
jgi:hypothetical protein